MAQSSPTSSPGPESDRTGPEQTHFGYRTVNQADKAGLVAGVFSSVADRYDLMNDLMSVGMHRLWKRFAVSRSGLRPGDRALDVAGGSGDLALSFARIVGPDGQVVLTDINADMLSRGKDKLIDAGQVGNVAFEIADAESLPFEGNQFDCVSISFGLRNVTQKAEALASMVRVLKPGGRLMVLEFSRPVSPLLENVYDSYSFAAIPALGKLVADDAESYRYLVESIRRHPDQETLRLMMLDAGCDEVEVYNLTGGIVALHLGFKF